MSKTKTDIIAKERYYASYLLTNISSLLMKFCFREIAMHRADEMLTKLCVELEEMMGPMEEVPIVDDDQESCIQDSDI